MANLIERLRLLDWATLALAACLFLSPFVLGFTAMNVAAWTAWISAMFIAAFAADAITAFREWDEWGNVVLGGWLIIAPWIVGFAGVPMALWAFTVLGVIVVLLAAGELWQMRHQHPTVA